MRRELRTHQAMANLAARQYGIVTREQLNGLGYPDPWIDRAIAAGRLHAWHHGVLAVGHIGLSRHALCLAAVMFRGPGALLSYRSAAWLWGLVPTLEVPVEISVPWRGHKEGGPYLHHCPALRDEDRAVTERIPVTGMPRTLLDFSSVATLRRVEWAVDRADRLDLLDLGAVARILDEVRGHRGRGNLGRAIEIHGEKGFTRSGGEKRLLHLLRHSGIARPAVNNFIEGYELDFYWEEERFAVELDSWEHHRGRLSFESDRKRADDLALAGISTIRITGTRLAREPRQVVARISDHLELRRQELRESSRSPRPAFAEIVG